MRKSIACAISVAIALSSLQVFIPASGDHTEGPTARNVLLELFTATWCAPCAYADPAAEDIKTDYGERVSLLLYHVADDGFDFPSSDARSEDYSVVNLPNLWADGVESITSAESDSQAYNEYQVAVDSRLSKDSPLELEIIHADLSLGNITLKANLTAISSIPQSSFNVRFVIYENRLLYDVPKPNTIYNYVVRDIEERSVDVSSLPMTITQTFDHNTLWNYSNMGAVVFAQIGDIGEVLQSHSMSFGVGDEDNDGLPDEWEFLRLKTFLYSGDDDPDGDGFTNLQEFLNHTDPLKADSQSENSIEGYLWLALGAVIIAIAATALLLAMRWRRKGISEEEREDEEESENADEK